MALTKAALIKRIVSTAILSVLYTLMFAFILYGSWQYRLDHTIFDLCYAFVYFIFLFEGFKRIVKFFNLNIKHQKINITKANMAKAVFVFGLYSWLLLTTIAVVPFHFIMDGFVSPVDAAQELRLNYVLNFVFAILYFSVLMFYDIVVQLQQVRMEAVRLERARAEAHLETLKNQASPHFLFNSLNALSSLIYIDQDKAARFVEELSQIFRYVTEHKEKELVPLKSELEFIQAFYYLLKIRFRESLHLNLNVGAEKLSNLLPPLTLQLLVENAIKHNIVSKEDPLTINIEIEGEKVVVRNNLQRRNSSGVSTGIGLNNIISRYGYLSHEKVDVFLTSTEFIAKIPLLKGEAA
jgi:two-component system, LytTR family, sensor kinase